MKLEMAQQLVTVLVRTKGEMNERALWKSAERSIESAFPKSFSPQLCPRPFELIKAKTLPSVSQCYPFLHTKAGAASGVFFFFSPSEGGDSGGVGCRRRRPRLASPASAAVGVPRTVCAPGPGPARRREGARGCARPGQPECASPGVRAPDGDRTPGGCVRPEAGVCAGPRHSRPPPSGLLRRVKVRCSATQALTAHGVGRASTLPRATRVLAPALRHSSPLPPPASPPPRVPVSP